MSGYSKLFSEIVTSSIWSEDDKTRIVWITMLALKDKDGFVPAALPGLANAARVSLEACKDAITKLESPDEYSRTDDYDGKRIEKVDGGWLVLNHFKYRDKAANDPETVAARERQRKHRATREEEDKTYTESRLSHDVTACHTFEQFWVAYPRKIGKKVALKAFLKCKDMPDIQTLINAIEAQKNSKQWRKDSGQFIPHPSTWLNGARWNDVLEKQAEQRSMI